MYQKFIDKNGTVYVIDFDLIPSFSIVNWHAAKPTRLKKELA